MANLQKRLKELEKLKKKGVVTDEEYETRRAALITGEDPTPSSSAGPFKWGLFGCLGIIVAIFIVVIVIVVIAAASIDSDSGGAEDTRVAFREGSSGVVETAGSVKNKVTIERITDPAVSSSGFSQPDPGFHYMTIAVSIENVGERETTGFDVTLRTTDGFEYDDTLIVGLDSDLNYLQGLTSGGRVSSVLVFELRDGSTIEWLKFDPNPFAKGDLYFDN